MVSRYSPHGTVSASAMGGGPIASGNNTDLESITRSNQLLPPHNGAPTAHDTNQDQTTYEKKTYLNYTEVFVWGENKSGQLGIDSQLKLFTDPEALRPDFIQIPRSCSFNIVIS